MKKNKRILFITVILALAAAVLIYRNQKGTIRESLRNFAVSDTGSVTKIFLANKNGNSVLLERKDNFQWMVNGKYNARTDAIKIILATIKNVAVRTRIAKAGYNSVIKSLADEGIKCEIYQHGENTPMKIYYVGGSTQDVLGTFMMIENSDLPFITEVPGFQGYLTPRYSPFEKDWRDMTVFDLNPSEIKNITISYPQQPAKSFSIERTGNQFKIFSPETNQVIQHPDTIGLNSYLTFFKHLGYEGWDAEYSNQQRDSLLATTPINIIRVTDVHGTTKSMTCFPKPITRRSLAQTDSTGNPLKYDIDRMYAFTEGKEFVVIQYYVFGKIFRQFDDFDLDKRKDNKRRAR